MIELEREHLRKTYQICRLGFLILTVALVPACILTLLSMVGLLGDRRLLIWLKNSPWDEWTLTVSVWGSLIGTMLLWGRWDNKSWQRRTGFLLLLCLIDIVSWFMDHGKGNGPGPHEWLRDNLGSALGWAEFALMASLTGDYLVHLGLDLAEDSARSTRSLAATGAVVWMLHFCEATNWDAGWPLRPRLLTIQGHLLFMGWNLIWTIALVQVTALVIAAFRQTNRTLGEMEREDQEHDLLDFPSEASHLDLLATASARDVGQKF
ncbi:MAG: hypothetical protein ACP5XB_10005 [Isosphaeraceae bacterium]